MTLPTLPSVGAQLSESLQRLAENVNTFRDPDWRFKRQLAQALVTNPELLQGLIDTNFSSPELLDNFPLGRNVLDAIRTGTPSLRARGARSATDYLAGLSPEEGELISAASGLGQTPTELATGARRAAGARGALEADPELASEAAYRTFGVTREQVAQAGLDLPMIARARAAFNAMSPEQQNTISTKGFINNLMVDRHFHEQMANANEQAALDRAGRAEAALGVADRSRLAEAARYVRETGFGVARDFEGDSGDDWYTYLGNPQFQNPDHPEYARYLPFTNASRSRSAANRVGTLSISAARLQTLIKNVTEPSGRPLTGPALEQALAGITAAANENAAARGDFRRISNVTWGRPATPVTIPGTNRAINIPLRGRRLEFHYDDGTVVPLSTLEREITATMQSESNAAVRAGSRDATSGSSPDSSATPPRGQNATVRPIPGQSRSIDAPAPTNSGEWINLMLRAMNEASVPRPGEDAAAVNARLATLRTEIRRAAIANESSFSGSRAWADTVFARFRDENRGNR